MPPTPKIKKCNVKRNIASVTLTKRRGYLKGNFEGDFKGAFESAKGASKEFIDVLTGVDNSLDKVTNYASEVIETADAFTKLENQAKLAEAQLRRVFEQSDRDAEIQRRIRDDFNLTFQER